MSDFDEEAERERLREQFERDKRKREASERMSELLLKGATMTNKHCDACGDPVFRYQGQEFCPTCQQRVGGQEGQQPTGGQPDQAQPDRQPGEQAGQEAHSADADGGTAPAQPSEGDPSSAEPSVDPTEHVDPEAGRPPATQRDDRGTPDRSGAPEPDAGRAAGGDLGGARDSLLRTMTEMARKAEATEDVARKREYLAAAREAAEALAATDRVA